MVSSLLALGASGLAAAHMPMIDPNGDWTPYSEMSDEFDSAELDTSKWQVADGLLTSEYSGWSGRQPGLFDPSNVRVSGGMLELYAQAAQRNSSWPEGFDNYTTSYVASAAETTEGMFEIRFKLGSSDISSAWWFRGQKSELDMFEASGGPGLDGTVQDGHVIVSHQHIFRFDESERDGLPSKCQCEFNKAGDSCDSGENQELSFRLADDWHIMSLNWTASRSEMYLDGELVTAIDTPCMEPMQMKFDRETMTNWMTLPEPSSLPDAPFQVDYVRAWKKGSTFIAV